METVSVQPTISKRVGEEAALPPKPSTLGEGSEGANQPSSSSKPKRVRLSLPGRNGDCVTWEELRQLEEEHGVEAVRKWLKGGKLELPVEEAAPKSPAYVARMEALRRRAEQREYARMMEGVAPKGSHLSTTMTSLSPEHTGVGATGFQMAVVGLNMVIGIGCAFIGADYIARQFDLSPANRVAVSLTAMIFVMMLEMVLFIIRASRFDVLDEKRRKAKEGKLAPTNGLNLDFSQLADTVSHPPTSFVDKKTN